jgi:hypothetical protein
LPQFARLIVVSTQAPLVPHAPCPAAHWQTPEKQNWLAGQTLPQVPQLMELPEVSTQAAPHSLSDPAQPLAHLLCEHTIPVPHAVPHAPQFFGSEVVSTQAFEQVVCPARQPQTPALQACPLAQTLPHLPQLAGSVAVRTQFAAQRVVLAAQVMDCPPPSPGAVASCVAVVDASTTPPPELDEPPPDDEEEELPGGAWSVPSAAIPLAQSTDSTQVATAAATTANPRTNRRTEVRSRVVTFISYFTLPNSNPTTTVAMPSFVGSRPLRRRVNASRVVLRPSRAKQTALARRTEHAALRRHSRGLGSLAAAER